MKRHINIILCITLSIVTSGLFAQKNCNITYISNEGFILESGNKKIVVDGLFDKIDGNWCHSPSDDMLKMISNSEQPFNNIDIIAITHVHRDHFNKDVVSDYLIKNEKTLIICPKEVEEDLATTENFDKFKDRITAITPDINSDTNLILAGIPIRVMRLEHSHYMIADTVLGEMVNKHRNIENVGYLFKLNEINIFHCGDTNPVNEEEYSTYSLVDQGVDIAFLERIFVSKGEKAIGIINNYLKPQHIVLMHIAPDNLEFFTQHFNEKKNITIFEERLETMNLNID